MFIFPSPTQQSIEELQPIFKMFNGLCAGYHIDIMDGEFVPKKMGSIDLVNQLHKYTQNQLWVHLMVKNPIKYIEKLSIAPDSIISFHYEAVELDEAEKIAELIRHKNMRPSLAINPKTPLAGPLCLTHAFDHFLIMAVEPGSSGQKFIQKTITRAQELDVYQKTHSSHLSLALDGGVNTETIIPLKGLSIDHIAVTSGIFNTPDPVEAFKNLQKKESIF